MLTRLAALWHARNVRDGSEEDVRIAIEATLASFSNKWRPFLEEMMEDGLLTRVGLKLSFAHLSFQEYLAAVDLADPTGQPKEALVSFMGGNDWWKGALLFFVALTNRPSEMEEWLIRTAREHRRFGMESRVDMLREGLYVANPGYRSPLKGIPLSDSFFDFHLSRSTAENVTKTFLQVEEHDLDWLLGTGFSALAAED